MKLHYLAEAGERIAFIHDWWHAHRPDTPDLFDDELEETLARIEATPLLVGAIHRLVRGVEIRRVLMSKTRQFVYYAVHPADEMIVIHSVWGTARRHGLKL